MAANYTTEAAIVAAVDALRVTDANATHDPDDRWIVGGKEWAISGDHPHYYRVAVGSLSGGGGTSMALTPEQVLAFAALESNQANLQQSVIDITSAQSGKASTQDLQAVSTSLSQISVIVDDIDKGRLKPWAAGNTARRVIVSTPMIDETVAVGIGSDAELAIDPLSEASIGLWRFDWQYSGAIIHEETAPLAHHYIGDDTRGTVKIIADGTRLRYFRVTSNATLDQKKSNVIKINNFDGHTEVTT